MLARYDVLHMPRIDLYFTAETDQRPAENEQSIRPRGWDVIDVTPLIVLLSVDAILVLLDALATHGRDNGSWLADPRLLLATQDSYGEWFGDLTLLLVVTLLWTLYRRLKGPAYLAWSAVFTVILLSDVFSLHERLSRRLVAAAGLRRGADAGGGLRMGDLGEVAVWAALALLCVAILGIGHYRSAGAVRHHSRRLLLLLVALSLCAAGMDLLHVVLAGSLRAIATVAEEAGELALVSVVAGYVFSLVRAVRPRSARPRPAST